MDQISFDVRRLVYLLPVIVPAALAMFCTILIITLLIDRFSLLLILPGGLLAVIVTAVLLYRHFPVQKIKNHEVIASAVVLILAIGWGAFNTIYSSQHVYTNRDPGVYAQGGMWLVDNDSIKIPKTNILDENLGVTEYTAGFDQSEVNSNEIYTQGAHIVPALTGFAGRLLGDNAVFKAMPLFNSIAILALFAFARQIMRDNWAVFAAFLFSISLPVIYFARDTYTELLAAAFTFTALTLIVSASKSDSRFMWLMAGLITGASALTRVDALISIGLTILAVSVYFALVISLKRKINVYHMVYFMLGIAATTVIGLLDLSLLSSGYFTDLWPSIRQEYVLLAVILLVSLALIAVAQSTSVFSKLDKLTISYRGWVAAGLILIISLVMILRPLWLVTHNEELISPLQQAIIGMQRANSLPPDGTRDYGENTLTMASWYVGIVISLLAVIGIGLVAYRASVKRDIRWLLFLLVFSGVALIYLNKPSIFPDQIWASRRQLPVILPCIILFGTLALYWLYERYERKLGGLRKYVLVVFLTASVAAPLIISAPFITTRTYAPQLAQINQVCAAVPPNAAIVWLGAASKTMVQPTRTSCDVPSFGMVDPSLLISQEVLASIASTLSSKGYVPVIGATASGMNKEGAMSLRLSLVSTVSINEYETTLVKPPNQVVVTTSKVYLGTVENDGSITPLKEVDGNKE